MNATDVPLVSVVIPAYNAEKTLESTVRSAMAQNYPAIEMIIVDDGSTDHTPEIIRHLMAEDSRVRTVRLANSGVAAARNAGMAVSRGEFVAPLDADDLWHPDRIAEHVAALQAAGPDCWVAYSPFEIIDADDRIIRHSVIYRCSGRVFEFHLRHNIVGNGSSLTLRRAAALAAGGYPVFLRAEGLEGCEDLMLQLRLAHAGEYVSVARPLIGYRKVAGNMSTNDAVMLRSRVRVLREIGLLPGVASRPVFILALAEARGRLVAWLFRAKGRRAAFEEWRRQTRGVADAILSGLAAAALILSFAVKQPFRALLRQAAGPSLPGERFPG